MKTLLSAAISGVIFGLGLCLSSMTNPDKVIAFLDFFGAWDPSLSFVMFGAIAVLLPSYRRLKRMSKPLFAARHSMAPAKPVDGRLVAGASLFGVGWASVGYCPAPAIANAASSSDAFLVLGAMLAGIAIHDICFPRETTLGSLALPSNSLGTD